MSKTYEFQPQGVCSKVMLITISEDNTVENLQVLGGCHGNLQGIAALVRGMKVEEVVARLEGIKCGMKETSCPDQLAQGLRSLTP